MDAIKIPSPSAILDPPPPQTAVRPSANTQKNRSSPVKKSSGRELPPDRTQRPKQSKSRNGCTTCKAKRLKCDETKPSCQQCHRRNVTCGGYKKDFKWRPFEETMATAKTTTKKKASPPLDSEPYESSSPPPRKAARRTSVPILPINTSTGHDFAFSPTRSSFPDDDSFLNTPLSTSSTSLMNQTPSIAFCEDLLETFNVPPIPEPPEMEFSGFILSDSELDTVSHSLPIELEHPGMNTSVINDAPSFSSMLEDETDEVEDIIRQSETDIQLWPVQESPPLSTMGPMSNLSDMAKLVHQPDHPLGSYEGLILRFDRLTCGILSVKDGLTENPWRTYIWPMAKDSPALWHAVFAMAAFHSSKENPAMRVFGMDHMRKSINCMVQGMVQMQTDAALATTLSLAFAESWDQHTSTGILHLKGAKALMRQTLRSKMRRNTPIDELTRLQFLYNTWLYMDVIARLTAMDDGDQEDLGSIPFATPANGIHDVDPLMGCATTLFPLIGQVANLIQRVRKSEKTSFVMISQARELKNAIEQWDLPSHFNPPEDPNSELQDSIQTAYAYRWATLLYLHQAVPEIPSPSSAILADKTLKFLATVPLTSRTNIVHIFPLFAASCEFENEEDRGWILDRWEAMQNRLRIGNIDRCIDIIREVWRRRDSHNAEREKNTSVIRRESVGSPVNPMQPHSMHGSSGQNTIFSRVNLTGATNLRGVSTFSTVEELDFEQTVRGRQHWVGVMKDWNWEGKTSSLVN
ncbi:putative C6 finger domain protein [Talaromyces proteolyticus]|uniref:C6 finger domain protein n=1 Tax=Talaromyces proteolyticus TaxID=1131652 RepID=A0AAD4L112_9EURO|nr:putative C6 finger domain protein [Talaromyces proteolyticus]KAH8705572.1 putative C6 finger domain protein [Talaromyces proteolyticus]